MKYLVLLMLSVAVQSAVGADFNEIDIMAEPKAPYIIEADVDHLYHWTSQPSIDRLYTEDATPSKFPFDKHISNGSDLAKSFPSLSGVTAFFVWKNSVGGMGSSKLEMYADAKNPALIRFDMKKRLKILVLTSKETGTTAIDPSLLKEANIIFHTRQFNFHEFVIIDPSAVEKEITDPQILRSDIERDIKLFTDKSMSHDKNGDLEVSGDLYNFYGRLSGDFISVLLPILNQFMNSHSPSCEALFSTK